MNIVNRAGRIVRTVRHVLEQLKQKQAATLAASVSFFAFISLFPFFLFVISLAGVFLKKGTALAKLEEYVKVFPEAVSGIVMNILQGMLKSSRVLSVVSFLFLILSSFGVFSQLRSALNRILGSERAAKGWPATLKTFSFFLITACGIVVVVLSGSTLFIIAERLGRLPIVKSYYFIMPAYILIEGLFLAFSYHYLSYRTFGLKHAMAGGFAVAILWEVLKHVFGWYVSAISLFSAMPGIIGSITMLQLWIFFSIWVYFAGAQLCLSLGRPSQRSGE
ncbi:MAG: YihY/virulence factor BrkB family protein [Candidatus Aminicenantales bacterium]